MSALVTHPTWEWIDLDEGKTQRYGGCEGGDAQASDTYSRRFARQLDSGLWSVITETYYVIDPREMFGPHVGRGWDIENQTEFIICRDLDDVGGTEVTSDYQTEHPLYTFVRTKRDAVKTARTMAENTTPGYYAHWNGVPA
jgi:hypothetical protein